MNRFILPALCCIMLLSCKKENTSPAPIENSHQLLSKIIKTIDFGGGTYAVEYQFNSAGKIIKEDNKTYERDAQERIVRIEIANTVLNGIPIEGYEIKVYYSSVNPYQVAYTLSGTDSTAYIHDDNGRLIKTMSYMLSDPNNGMPDATSLSEYYILVYDAAGNLVTTDRFVINYDGKTTHCSHNEFGRYDKSINPLYSGDEVRVVEHACQGMLNSSKNNFTSGNGYTKMYEYRGDGRPRNCVIQQDGRNVSKLVFEYD